MRDIRILRKTLNSFKMTRTLFILVLTFIGVSTMNIATAQVVASGDCGANGNKLFGERLGIIINLMA